jgi:WhiB family redox-sensing transcriptional regulator
VVESIRQKRAAGMPGPQAVAEAVAEPGRVFRASATPREGPARPEPIPAGPGRLPRGDHPIRLLVADTLGPAMPDLARPGLTVGDELGDVGALLELLTSRPAWHADAACKEHAEVSWFPARGETGEAAKAICASCLVAEECRAWAAGQDRLVGIWGGLSGHERRTGATSAEQPRRQTVARCTRCEAGRICDACQERSTRRRLTDAELFPSTVALLARLG